MVSISIMCVTFKTSRFSRNLEQTSCHWCPTVNITDIAAVLTSVTRTEYACILSIFFIVTMTRLGNWELHKDSQKPGQPYQRLVPLISLEFTGEYSATARRAAVTRVRGGANLNCASQLREIVSHPCTAYRQLKFCVQSLLDRLYKHSKFQVRFRPDKPDHSLVTETEWGWELCSCASDRVQWWAVVNTVMNLQFQ
jgi:hypothetical protein